MGTKIINLPSVNKILEDAYFPISQDITGGNRDTYKVTAKQIATYIGQATSTATVNEVSLSSSDSSILVTGSPITTKGVIDVKINSVTLDKLDDGGAQNGYVLTYDSILQKWNPIPSSNTGVTADSVQIGTVLWFAASSAPIGYLECDGSSKRISDYTELAQIVGTTYGALINGGTEFILPDLRGEFIRGWAHGKSGVNTGRNFGSKETDTTANPKNTTLQRLNSDGTLTSLQAGTSNPSHAGFARVVKDGSENFTVGSTVNATINELDIVQVVGGDPETRPQNVALLPCIKALKTVQGTTSLLNFIPKPTSPIDGNLLMYQNSTSSWVASSINSTSSQQPIIYTQTGTLLASFTTNGVWFSLKSLMPNPWSYYFGFTPNRVNLLFFAGQKVLEYTVGEKIPTTSILYTNQVSRAKLADIGSDYYVYKRGFATSNNNHVTTSIDITLNSDSDVYFRTYQDGGVGTTYICIGNNL